MKKTLTAVHAAAAYSILIPIGIALWVAIIAGSRLMRFVSIALLLTLTGHALAHTLSQLLLPLDRTRLFLWLSAIACCTMPP